MTSQAVAAAIPLAARALLEDRQRAAIAEEPWRPSSRDIGTMAVTLFGIVLAFTQLRRFKSLRIAFQLVLIVYLGFLNGDLVSQAFLVGAARNGLPWQSAAGLSALTVAALIVPLASTRQVYCHHLCPHGAAQQLLKRRIKWQWHPPRWLHRAASALPWLLLALVIAVALRNWSINLAALEPFDAYLIHVAGWGSLAVAAVGLLASLFVPMAYCRYGCPTGALLNYFRRNAHSGRWSRQDTLAAGLLALALVLLGTATY